MNSCVPSFEGFFNVADFGAVGDGRMDNTVPFQSALDEAGKKGGIVYAGPGKYRFEGHLNVPVGVTLMGTFSSVPAHNGHRDKGLPNPGDYGTVLEPCADKGKEDAPAFITLNTNSTLKGVLVFYPEQVDDNRPYAYPWCLAMRGKNPAILDTELLNPYNGIDASGNERHMIARVYGQPLRRGIFVDAVYDIGRIEDVHFNPWWSMQPAVRKLMVEEGEAFILGRTDWEYMVNCFAIFYKVGFVFDDFGNGAGNADLTQCGHDMAPVTVQVNRTQRHAGVSFSNCQMMGDMVVADTNDGPVRMNGCGFWGIPQGDKYQPVTKELLTLGGRGHVIVNGCHFCNWNADFKNSGVPSPCIDIHCKSCAVNTCDFIDNKPLHVRIGKETKGCVIMGNKFAQGPFIENLGDAVVECGLNITTGDDWAGV